MSGPRWTEQQVRANNAEAIKAMTTKNKYGAKKVFIDGYTFDSKAEGRRYSELKLMEKARHISNLEVHPLFRIDHINYLKNPLISIHICDVILDFQYLAKTNGGEFIYEDVKGKDTDISRLKRKLVEAYYGIKVEVIK